MNDVRYYNRIARWRWYQWSMVAGAILLFIVILLWIGGV